MKLVCTKCKKRYSYKDHEVQIYKYNNNTEDYKKTVVHLFCPICTCDTIIKIEQINDLVEVSNLKKREKDNFFNDYRRSLEILEVESIDNQNLEIVDFKKETKKSTKLINNKTLIYYKPKDLEHSQGYTIRYNKPVGEVRYSKVRYLR